MYTRCFYCFQVYRLSRENNSKALFWVFSILSAYLKLCTFSLKVERDELVLGGVRLLLSRIPYFRLYVYDMKNSSFIRRSLPL